MVKFEELGHEYACTFRSPVKGLGVSKFMISIERLPFNVEKNIIYDGDDKKCLSHFLRIFQILSTLNHD